MIIVVVSICPPEGESPSALPRPAAIKQQNALRRGYFPDAGSGVEGTRSSPSINSAHCWPIASTS
jgi:hypothetical protein